MNTRAKPAELQGADFRPLQRAASAAGFTLIEVVVSAALMAMILAGAYLCLSAGLASEQLIESRAEALQSARVAMATMTADLRSACVLSRDFEFLGLHRLLGEVEADNLDFATHNYVPRRPREGDFCEISYFLEKDRESGRFNLWRRRNPTLAPNPLSGGLREVIAQGLQGLRFEYYDGYEWYDAWGDVEGHRREPNSLLEAGNRSGMPEAVRITLWFDTQVRSTPAASAKPDTQEPPLVFQTVVGLNLAASSRRVSGSGASTNAAPGAAGNTPGSTTTGGGY